LNLNLLAAWSGVPVATRAAHGITDSDALASDDAVQGVTALSSRGDESEERRIRPSLSSSLLLPVTPRNTDTLATAIDKARAIARAAHDDMRGESEKAREGGGENNDGAGGGGTVAGQLRKGRGASPSPRSLLSQVEERGEGGWGGENRKEGDRLYRWVTCSFPPLLHLPQPPLLASLFYCHRTSHTITVEMTLKKQTEKLWSCIP